MKVFLSWSGDQSRQVAEAFSDWVQCVIQACKPWISTRDIERGSVWFSEISDQLKDVSIGIIFLTQENKNRPWILFEAGALAKGLTNNRVCTFLIDLLPGDIQDPLAQFNHTHPSKVGVSGLVRTLNASLSNPLDDKSLSRVIDTYWPQLEEELTRISALFPAVPEGEQQQVDEKHALQEIMDSLKTLNNRVARMENPRSSRTPAKRVEISELSLELMNDESMKPPSSAEAMALMRHYKEVGFSKADIQEKMLARSVPLSWLEVALRQEKY